MRAEIRSGASDKAIILRWGNASVQHRDAVFDRISRGALRRGSLSWSRACAATEEWAVGRSCTQFVHVR